MSQPELTERQGEVYNFIVQTMREKSHAPTIREIGYQIRADSPNGVMCHLNALKKKGYIDWTPYMARSITLVQTDPCPHCGGLGRVPR